MVLPMLMAWMLRACNGHRRTGCAHEWHSCGGFQDRAGPGGTLVGRTLSPPLIARCRFGPWRKDGRDIARRNASCRIAGCRARAASRSPNGFTAGQAGSAGLSVADGCLQERGLCGRRRPDNANRTALLERSRRRLARKDSMANGKAAGDRATCFRQRDAAHLLFGNLPSLASGSLSRAQQSR